MTPEKEAALAKLDAQLERITTAHPDLMALHKRAANLTERLYQAAIILQGRQEGDDLPASAEQLTLTAEALSDLGDDLRLPAT